MINAVPTLNVSTYLGTAASVVAAAWDVKTRRIPNLLTFPLFGAALVLHLLSNGWKDALSALAAGVIGGAVFLIFYVAGGMGAGDVKLMTAVGACYSLAALPHLLVLTSIAGGVMALILAARHGRLRQTFGNMGVLASHHAHAGLVPHEDLNVKNVATLRLPYAMAICAGCILTNFVLLG